MNISKRIVRRLILIFSILFIVFLVLYTIYVKISQLDSVSIGIESILVLAYAFYFFFELVNNPNVLFINQDFRFWITIGMSLYLAGTFFLYIFAQSFPIKEIRPFWILTYIFYIIKSIFFCVAIIINSKKTNNLKTQELPYLDF